jgi:hypothetical protein
MGIIRRALAITFTSMGTTAVALGGGFLGFISRAVVGLYHDGWAKGWPVVKASLVGDAGIGLLVAGTVWLIVFLVSLGRAIEERKESYRPHGTGAPNVAKLIETISGLQIRLGEMETLQSHRRLSDEATRSISRVVRKELSDLRQSLLDAGWPLEEANATICIQLLTIENDRETVIYRNEIASAFRNAGLGVVTGQLLGVPVGLETEQFVNCVTVVRGNPENKVRAFIIESLREAGLTINESDDIPPSAMSLKQHSTPTDLAAVLIVGQHGR